MRRTSAGFCLEATPRRRALGSGGAFRDHVLSRWAASPMGGAALLHCRPRGTKACSVGVVEIAELLGSAYQVELWVCAEDEPLATDIACRRPSESFPSISASQRIRIKASVQGWVYM